MKPKSTHKQAATHNRDTKQTTKHKKERPKTQLQDLSRPSKISHPISKRLVPGAGDCASLVCRFVTARCRSAGCGVALPIVGTFPAERRRWVQKSYFCRWSRWVSKRKIRLGSDIRSGKNGVDAVEKVTKRVKMVEKTIRRTSVSSGTTSEKPIYIPR
jgi:hypothetical protein